MSTPQDPIPAFPTAGRTTSETRHGYDGESRTVTVEDVPAKPGMELRDWLAGQETLIEWDQPSASMPIESAEQLAGRPRPSTGNYVDVLKWEAEWRAALKYIYADAMMARRAKR